MATVNKKILLLPPSPPKLVVRIRFVLELSENEAQTLAYVLAKIGGASSDTRRRYTQEILDKLKKADIDWRGYTRKWEEQAGLFFESEALDPEKD